MTYTLQYYISCFESLNCNKRQGHTAPHKAVLLLAIMEEIQLGHITNGFIPINDQMIAAFRRVWHRYVGESSLFNPVFETPFFHLGYEPFWELMKREPFDIYPEYSLARLRKNFFGAKIHDDLCQYIADESSRHKLKNTLVAKYLSNYPHDTTLSLAAET